MEYNFERRELYFPDKYFRKDRHVTLTTKENTIFSLLWINKQGSRSYEELAKVLYGADEVTEYDKNNIRRIVFRLRKKGAPIESVNGYGYKLKGGN